MTARIRPPEVAPLVLLHLAAFLIAGALAAVGCGRVLVAGREEAQGRLEAARRLARRGGFEMILATPAQITASFILAASPTLRPGLLPPDGDPVAAVALSLFTVLALASAFAGLLAGLSGKPRPTGWVAAGLLILDVVAWALAIVRLWPAPRA